MTTENRVFAEFGDEQKFSDALLKHYSARISNAAAFAREHRVLLLRSTIAVGLDVALAALPYEALVIERSSYFVYPPDVPLRTRCAEDWRRGALSSSLNFRMGL